MTALTADRDTPERSGQTFRYVSKAAEMHYAGAGLCLDTNGEAVAPTATTGLKTVGRVKEYVDNTLDGEYVEAEGGCFKYANSGTNAVTQAHIGSACYWEDDQTVGSLATGMSVAGIVAGVDSDGVWVKMDPPGTIVSGLAAANNLSDIAAAATARVNLGVQKRVLEMQIVNLVGGDAKVYRTISPWAGTIDVIRSILEHHALGTGDATLTFSIAGTPITTGIITIAQSGSAAGDKDSCSPSAAKTVAAGDAIECTVGGTNDDTDAQAHVTLEITV